MIPYEEWCVRVDWLLAHLREIGPACPDCEEGPYECRCGDAGKEAIT